jgi:hypothetical protein
MNHIIYATYTNLHTHKGGTTNLASNYARGRKCVANRGELK